MEESGVMQRVNPERSPRSQRLLRRSCLIEFVKRFARSITVAEPRAPTSIGFADTSSFTGNGIL